MHFSSLLLAMAPAPGGGNGGGGGSMWTTLLFFGAMILIFYFMILRPQKKRQEEHKRMLSGVKKGDKIVTASGIHGTVSDVEDNTLLLQIADNVRIRIDKAAIGSVENKQAEAK